VLDAVAHVLTAGYNYKRTTLITTHFANRPPATGRKEDTMGDRIGERMRCHLTEMCVCLEMQAQDSPEGWGSAIRMVGYYSSARCFKTSTRGASTAGASPNRTPPHRNQKRIRGFNPGIKRLSACFRAPRRIFRPNFV
jgi:hypothetical protein